MSNTVNTADIYKLTQPLWKKVQAGYRAAEKEFKRFVDVVDVKEADVKTNQLQMFGVAPFVQQGKSFNAQGYRDYGSKIFYILKYGMLCNITREAIQDNLYKNEAPRLSESFRKSFIERENIEAAGMINNALNPAFLAWDNLPLWASSRPTGNGSTWQNGFSEGTPLSETVLEAMLTMIGRFLDPAGLRITDVRAEKLVIPIDMIYQADRLLSSYLRPGTANHDINAIKHLGMLKEVVPSHYINPAYFFIRTSNPGMYQWMREDMEMNSVPNYTKDEIAIVAFMRYVFGFDDARCTVGAYQPLNMPVS